MRTFIELAMPDGVREVIRRRQDEARRYLAESGVESCFRWTNLSSVHLTLRFLGETYDRQRASLAEGLDEIAQSHAPLALGVGGLGAFPNAKQPRVLWLGVVGDLDGLRALQAEVERLAQSCGFDTEDRPYSPHLTLARTKREAARGDVQRAGERMGQMLERPPRNEAEGRFSADRIVHVRSDLRPNGAVYTPLSAAPLTG